MVIMIMIMVIIVVNMNRIMPMTYLCQWFLFCRELPAPETWCPLLPGNLIIIMLMIKNHADSDSIQWFWPLTLQYSNCNHEDYDDDSPHPPSPKTSPSQAVSTTLSSWMWYSNTPIVTTMTHLKFTRRRIEEAVAGCHRPVRRNLSSFNLFQVCGE